MKRYPWIALVFSVLLLAACGGPPDFADRAPGAAGADSIEGTLEALPKIDIYRQGTHQIVTASGESVLVQSASINLSRYVGKNVVVFGRSEESVGDAEPVFSVTKIESAGEGISDGMQPYENAAAGFKFDMPGTWEIKESIDEVLIFEGGSQIIRIAIDPTGETLETFVAKRETEKGEPVTIGTQPAVRITDEKGARFYVANPSRKKIYSLVLAREAGDLTSWLESFTPLYSQTVSGKRCGGPAGLKCGEGFRCELYSAEKDAAGVCVALSALPEDLACPFIPKPADCENAEAAQFGANGCPTRYVCADDGAIAKAEAPDPARVMDTIEKYKDKILESPGAVISSFEITPELPLIAVVYGDEKRLFFYEPSGNEFNFSRRAIFKKENGEWVLIKGEDLQAGQKTEVIYTGN